VSVKIVRAVIIGIFDADLVRNFKGNGVSSSIETGFDTPYSKAERILQFCDNTCVVFRSGGRRATLKLLQLPFHHVLVQAARKFPLAGAHA
jgi:hypothetical protein